MQVSCAHTGVLTWLQTGCVIITMGCQHFICVTITLPVSVESQNTQRYHLCIENGHISENVARIWPGVVARKTNWRGKCFRCVLLVVVGRLDLKNDMTQWEYPCKVSCLCQHVNDSPNKFSYLLYYLGFWGFTYFRFKRSFHIIIRRSILIKLISMQVNVIALFCSFSTMWIVLVLCGDCSWCGLIAV